MTGIRCLVFEQGGFAVKDLQSLALGWDTEVRNERKTTVYDNAEERPGLETNVFGSLCG